LYLAFELSEEKWRLGFSIGLAQSPREREIKARDIGELRKEINLAKRRFRLSEATKVKSCYEAGRDGFWLHRCLLARGVENLVVDSASIEVSRRAKRVKTDRLDVKKLLSMLIRYHGGDRRIWSVVNVPSVEAEDNRHLHRQLETLKAARKRHICRIKALLATQGLKSSVGRSFLDDLEGLRLWDGSPVQPGLRARLKREFNLKQVIETEIRALEAERRELIRTSDHPSVEMVRQLLKLRGIGETSAWLFVMEFYGWRELRNRREIGGLAGLTPTPYQSGGELRDQGISKAGNPLVRSMAVEIAWGWLRFQPDSYLTRWYQEKFGQGSKRARKVGIVALARKLLVALHSFLMTGVIPEGAQLNA
jgi:transposase